MCWAYQTHTRTKTRHDAICTDARLANTKTDAKNDGKEGARGAENGAERLQPKPPAATGNTYYVCSLTPTPPTVLSNEEREEGDAHWSACQWQLTKPPSGGTVRYGLRRHSRVCVSIHPPLRRRFFFNLPPTRKDFLGAKTIDSSPSGGIRKLNGTRGENTWFDWHFRSRITCFVSLLTKLRNTMVSD